MNNLTNLTDDSRSNVGQMQEATWQGQTALIYLSSQLRVVVLPERGGKIASILDLANKEWLEQPTLPMADFKAKSSDFIDGDMCGWDECGPTISPCKIGNTRLSDHGELWSQAWRRNSQDWLTVRGRHWDYEFSRRIKILGSQILLEYRIESANESFPFLWAAHPQFRVDESTEIIFPDHVSHLVDVLSQPPLRRVPVHEIRDLAATKSETCRKFYIEPESEIHAVGLRHGDGSQLMFTWSKELPYAGIWIDRSAYARHDVIALEPSTGFYDSCEEAFRRGKVLIVPPHTICYWSLTVSISHASNIAPEISSHNKMNQS